MLSNCIRELLKIFTISWQQALILALLKNPSDFYMQKTTLCLAYTLDMRMAWSLNQRKWGHLQSRLNKWRESPIFIILVPITFATSLDLTVH